MANKSLATDDAAELRVLDQVELFWGMAPDYRHRPFDESMEVRAQPCWDRCHGDCQSRPRGELQSCCLVEKAHMLALPLQLGPHSAMSLDSTDSTPESRPTLGLCPHSAHTRPTLVKAMPLDSTPVRPLRRLRRLQCHSTPVRPLRRPLRLQSCCLVDGRWQWPSPPKAVRCRLRSRVARNRCQKLVEFEDFSDAEDF